MTVKISEYMKRKFFVWIIVACLTTPLSAVSVDEMWNEAARYYADKEYESAAECYERLFEYGESASLYYNYANALYKSGNLGGAILNYERALLLDPSDEDILFNLEYANRMKTDKIEPVGRFFLSEWLDTLGHKLSSDSWAYMGIATFVLMLALLLLYLFGRNMALRKTAFFSSLVLLVITVTSFVYAFYIKNDVENNLKAIVMSGSVSVKSSPDDGGTEVFVIHEGTKVTVKSTLNVWSEIVLADGNVGWLPSEDIQIINLGNR